jgi:hypothetical protein
MGKWYSYLDWANVMEMGERHDVISNAIQLPSFRLSRSLTLLSEFLHHVIER